MVSPIAVQFGGSSCGVARNGTTFTVRMPFGTAHLPVDQTGARPSLRSTSIRADAFVQEAMRWLPDSIAVESVAIKDVDEPGGLLGLPAGSRVLLADDNADMRQYIRRLLSDKCEVRIVADGLTALNDIREHRPDLVLADVMMPGLDGFELLRQIRADASIRDIPVILLSARAGRCCVGMEMKKSRGSRGISHLFEPRLAAIGARGIAAPLETAAAALL